MRKIRATWVGIAKKLIIQNENRDDRFMIVQSGGSKLGCHVIAGRVWIHQIAVSCFLLSITMLPSLLLIICNAGYISSPLQIDRWRRGILFYGIEQVG